MIHMGVGDDYGLQFLWLIDRGVEIPKFSLAAALKKTAIKEGESLFGILNLKTRASNCAYGSKTTYIHKSLDLKSLL
jgi:hypothetical protein